MAKPLEPHNPNLRKITDSQSGERDDLRHIAAQTFRVPYEQIDETSSPESVQGWDSVGHLSLVVAIEQYYAVRLAPEDIAQMNSIAEIRALLRRRRSGEG
jgi:acyl carrier protein